MERLCLIRQLRDSFPESDLFSAATAAETIIDRYGKPTTTKVDGRVVHLEFQPAEGATIELEVRFDDEGFQVSGTFGDMKW